MPSSARFGKSDFKNLYLEYEEYVCVDIVFNMLLHKLLWYRPSSFLFGIVLMVSLHVILI